MGNLGGTALAGVLFSNDRGKFTAATHVTRGENLSPVQRFARFFGAAYPLVGLTEVYPASPARWPVARGPRTPRRVAVGSVRLPLVPQPDACDHRDNRPRRLPDLSGLASPCPGSRSDLRGADLVRRFRAGRLQPRRPVVHRRDRRHAARPDLLRRLRCVPYDPAPRERARRCRPQIMRGASACRQR